MAGWRDLLGTTLSSFKIGVNKSTLDASAITAARNHALPNLSGTLALTSQLPVANTGTVIIDFGVFPGADSASVVVTGQTAVTATSAISARVVAVATSDHSADEHIMSPPQILVGAIVAGVGFTIYATAKSSDMTPIGSRLLGAYGQFTMNWNY